MIEVFISIGKDLIFFTQKKYASGVINLKFEKKRSIKDLIESIGIPHVEIGCVIRNGIQVSVDYVINGSCRLEVQPPVLRRPPLSASGYYSAPRFILDVHLGRLAVNLRMLGFSADYSNCRNDDELASLVEGDGMNPGRILLSCDRGLLMRKNVAAGMVIRSRDPVEQTAEVLRRYSLTGRVNAFTRCLNCGGFLEAAGELSQLSDDEKKRLPQNVRQWCREYSRCTGCGQIYWKGSHFKKMETRIAEILAMSS